MNYLLHICRYACQYSNHLEMPLSSPAAAIYATKIPTQHPWSSCHHWSIISIFKSDHFAWPRHTPIQSACIASTIAAPWSCMLCTLIAEQPSSLSSPSCGKRALSDHRIRIACDRSVFFLAQTMKPVFSVSTKYCDNVSYGQGAHGTWLPGL